MPVGYTVALGKTRPGNKIIFMEQVERIYFVKEKTKHDLHGAKCVSVLGHRILGEREGHPVLFELGPAGTLKEIKTPGNITGTSTIWAVEDTEITEYSSNMEKVRSIKISDLPVDLPAPEKAPVQICSKYLLVKEGHSLAVVDLVSLKRVANIQAEKYITSSKQMLTQNGNTLTVYALDGSRVEQKYTREVSSEVEYKLLESSLLLITRDQIRVATREAEQAFPNTLSGDDPEGKGTYTGVEIQNWGPLSQMIMVGNTTSLDLVYIVKSAKGFEIYSPEEEEGILQLPFDSGVQNMFAVRASWVPDTNDRGQEVVQGPTVAVETDSGLLLYYPVLLPKNITDMHRSTRVKPYITTDATHPKPVQVPDRPAQTEHKEGGREKIADLEESFQPPFQEISRRIGEIRGLRAQSLDKLAGLRNLALPKLYQDSRRVLPGIEEMLILIQEEEASIKEAVKGQGRREKDSILLEMVESGLEKIQEYIANKKRNPAPMVRHINKRIAELFVSKPQTDRPASAVEPVSQDSIKVFEQPLALPEALRLKRVENPQPSFSLEGRDGDTIAALEECLAQFQPDTECSLIEQIFQGEELQDLLQSTKDLSISRPDTSRPAEKRDEKIPSNTSSEQVRAEPTVSQQPGRLGSAIRDFGAASTTGNMQPVFSASSGLAVSSPLGSVPAPGGTSAQAPVTGSFQDSGALAGAQGLCNNPRLPPIPFSSLQGGSIAGAFSSRPLSQPQMNAPQMSQSQTQPQMSPSGLGGSSAVGNAGAQTGTSGVEGQEPRALFSFGSSLASLSQNKNTLSILGKPSSLSQGNQSLGIGKGSGSISGPGGITGLFRKK